MNCFYKISAHCLFIFLGKPLFAQINCPQPFYDHILKIEKNTFYYVPSYFIEKNTPEKTAVLPENYSLKLIDLSDVMFNCNDLAPFCRLEWQMEKAAKFPIKFRIGEVQYVEQMEGKY